MRSAHARWVLACAIAETIGMTTAAAAGRAASGIADDRRWLALVVVVAGGLVEGTALGVLQGRALATTWPALDRRAYLVLTVLVAGLGWAGASAPGVLADGADSSAGPSVGLMVLGGLGLGLVLGPVLGGAQAVALRRVVRHPRRWLVANAAAWPLAMAVIFIGAATAGASWSLPGVAGWGALTGAVAGSALGLVSGLWLASLDDQPLANRVVLTLLDRRWLGFHRRVVGLAVRGRRSGRVVRFPVEYAPFRDGLVVVPGHPDRKTWWRNLDRFPEPVAVLDAHGWHPARARVLLPGASRYDAALAAYRERWPHFDPAPEQPVVLLTGVVSGIGRPLPELESVV